jgi:RNA polymerase sigma-70 factor, ECF subfamily
MLGPETLSRLFAAHAAGLTLYASQWLDRAAAEDVVHDVYLRLMEQDEEPANAKAWLYRSVRNAAISAIRSRSRRRAHESSAATHRSEWFVPGDDDAIDAAQAQHVLQSLETDHREIVALRIWAQMSFKEIAAVVDLPLSTVFDRYRTALDEIKRKLETPCPMNKS